jgi:hypothetical protein
MLKQPLKIKEFLNQLLDQKEEKLAGEQDGNPESSLNIISLKPTE